MPITSTEIDARVNTIGDLVMVTGTIDSNVSLYNFDSLVSKIYAFDVIYEEKEGLSDFSFPFCKTTSNFFTNPGKYSQLSNILTVRDDSGTDRFETHKIYAANLYSIIGDTVIMFNHNDSGAIDNRSMSVDCPMKFMLIGRR